MLLLALSLFCFAHVHSKVFCRRFFSCLNTTLSRKSIQFVALSQTSHIIAPLGLAQELKARGHRVTFASFEQHESVVFGVPFVSLGKQPNPDSYYNYARDGPNFLTLINDLSIAGYDRVKALWDDKGYPDLVIFDALFPAVYPLCEKVTCIAFGAAVPELVFPGVSDAPGMLKGVTLEDLHNSFMLRLKNFFAVRAMRYVFPIVKGLFFRRFWSHVGHTVPKFHNYFKTEIMTINAPTPGCKGV